MYCLRESGHYKRRSLLIAVRHFPSAFVRLVKVAERENRGLFYKVYTLYIIYQQNGHFLN